MTSSKEGVVHGGGDDGDNGELYFLALLVEKIFHGLTGNKVSFKFKSLV